MTIAELNRLVESKKQIMKREAQEKASYDYILANLVGVSVGRLYSSSNNFPSIEEVYPNLFDSEAILEEKQKQKDELSVIRFKQFANSYNKKYEGGNK